MVTDNGAVYYELIADLPSLPISSLSSQDKILTYQEEGKIGEQYSIWTKDGAVHFSADVVRKNPQWFRPVFMDEHKERCKESLIVFAMEHNGYTREEAEQFQKDFVAGKFQIKNKQ